MPNSYNKPADVLPLSVKGSGRKSHAVMRPSKHNHDRRADRITRQFIAWDGEAVQDGADYCLFGNSEGMEICSPNLGTAECLDLILETARRYPKAYHISFAFNYDVNNILRELGWIRLITLNTNGEVKWNGYTIKHIPGKSFSVKKGSLSARIDDIFSFFRCRYDKALAKYSIGTAYERAQISRGKDSRPEFRFADIDNHIRPYWQLELKLMVQLMDQMRRDFNAAGYVIGQWHGPGALAAYALRTHGIGQHQQPTPNHLDKVVRTAFAGGWFERFKCGRYVGPIFTADINSAYAYAIAQLPSLRNAKWRYAKGPNRDNISHTRFAVYHIRLSAKFGEGFKRWGQNAYGLPFPLFFRQQDGSMSHPTQLDGWYWQPEAALVANDPRFEIVEAWILEDDGSYPFAWVSEMYDVRLAMQAENNPAEKALKWILASLFGRCAQRVGWDKRTRTPPKSHQLEWAGFITSMCRSMVYAAAAQSAAGGGLVSIDTDGVISTSPFGELPNGMGNQLGRWKVDEYSELVYVQNGIYWLRGLDGKWEQAKARGIPGSKIGDPGIALDAFNSDGIIRLQRHQFVGYGAALAHGFNGRDTWRTWQDSDTEINVHRAGGRRHIAKWCRQCNEGFSLTQTLHDLRVNYPEGGESKPHSLPWQNVDERKIKREIIRHHLLEEW